mgnify:CR=1 FL=1
MAQGVYVLSDTNEHCRQQQDSRERVRPAQAGRSVSSRLDRNTLLRKLHEIQPARRKMRIHHWPNAGCTEITTGCAKPEKRKIGLELTPSPEQQAHNQVRSTVRAKKQLRQDLLSILADRMLTLTYRSNMQDRAQAIADLKRFNRQMRYRFQHWASVAVLEWQKRGAAHFHLGIAGFYQASVVREVWREIVGEGNVDIAFEPRGRGNHCSKLATYMCKYMAKNLDEGRQPGEHRYFRCQVPDHLEEVYYIADDAPRGIEKRLIYETLIDLCPQGKGGRDIWISPTGYGGLCGIAEKLPEG